MIKNNLPDKSGNPESLKKQSKQFESFSINVSMADEDILWTFYRLFYLQFCNSSDKWKSKFIAKVLLAIWVMFLHENSRNYNSYRFSQKICFYPLFVFKNQKQESDFQQVGGLVTGNISVFCL